MRRIGWLGVLVALLVGTTAPLAAHADGEPQVAPAAEAEFLGRINHLRTSKGLDPLAMDEGLVELARRWATAMANAGQVSHNPDLRQQVTESWQKLGENVGEGPNVDALYNAFVASSPHYQNLVEPGFTRVG